MPTRNIAGASLLCFKNIRVQDASSLGWIHNLEHYFNISPISWQPESNSKSTAENLNHHLGPLRKNGGPLVSTISWATNWPTLRLFWFFWRVGFVSVSLAGCGRIFLSLHVQV